MMQTTMASTPENTLPISTEDISVRPDPGSLPHGPERQPSIVPGRPQIPLYLYQIDSPFVKIFTWLGKWIWLRRPQRIRGPGPEPLRRRV